MLKCWQDSPTQRPTFEELVQEFDAMLVSLSDKVRIIYSPYCNEFFLFFSVSFGFVSKWDPLFSLNKQNHFYLRRRAIEIFLFMTLKLIGLVKFTFQALAPLRIKGVASSVFIYGKLLYAKAAQIDRSINQSTKRFSITLTSMLFQVFHECCLELNW